VGWQRLSGSSSGAKISETGEKRRMSWRNMWLSCRLNKLMSLKYEMKALKMVIMKVKWRK
jgi:hypothetical protein